MKIVRSLVLAAAVASLTLAAHARTFAQQPSAATNSSSPSYDVRALGATRDSDRHRTAASGNSADGSLCGLTLVATCVP